MVLIPVMTALVGYHTLVVKSDVLAQVKSDYVAKGDLVPIVQRIESHTKEIEIHTGEIKQLTANFHQNELTIKEISTNLKYITDLLNELKIDVKRIGERPGAGK